jgi:hypothetical protein
MSIQRAFVPVALAAALFTACGGGGQPATPDVATQAAAAGRLPLPAAPPSSPATPVPPVAQANTANASSGVGSNVSQFNYWSAEFAFKDAFRRARAWSCTGTCTYDADGWPLSGQSATTLFADLAGKYPAGRYVTLYDAAAGASITYGGQATKNAALSRPGRDVVDVVASGVLTMTVNGAVRRIRMLFPGGDCGNAFSHAASAADCPVPALFQSHEQTHAAQPFHGLFLAKMARYKSVRYLWWMLPDPYVKTPRLSAPVAWSQRPKVGDAIWFNRGVPLEYLVQLANTLGADPWFTLPHLANDLLGDNAADPYVRQFATYVRDHLAPNLKAYVEYSNEVWNGGPGGYEQANYAEERGLALGLSADRNQARFRYQAQQSVRLFGIWNGVFGDRGTRRVVRVLAAQGGNPWTGLQLMDWQDAYREADALAGAPYIDIPMPDQATVAAYTLDQLFDYINGARLPQIFTMVRANLANAGARVNSLGRPLEYVAYEGGQHLVELGPHQSNAQMNRLLDAANRDARMGQVYRELMTQWKASGGHLFEHFVNVMQYRAGGVGRFGLLESMLDNTSAKFDALMAFISENPKWW